MKPVFVKKKRLVAFFGRRDLSEIPPIVSKE